MEVVDVHQHIGELSNVLGDYGAPDVVLSLEDDLRSRAGRMEATGVTWAVIEPSHGYLKPDGIKDTMKVNDLVAEYRRRDPVHFPIALGTVEPTHGARSLEEVDRVKLELGLHGLAWHHRFQGCYIDNKWMRPILRRMSDLGMVAFVHVNAESNLESPWRLQRLAREFPEMTFVALDGFWSYERGLEIFEQSHDTPNILWDMGGPVNFVAAETWVARHGSERVTFSGLGGYSAEGEPRRPRMLDAILGSQLAEADKANILGGNVRRIFGMSPA